MKDTLTLNNNTILEIEAGASLSDIKIRLENTAGMAELYQQFTDDNLSHFTIKNSKGIVAAVYEHCTLIKMSVSPSKDGITCSISIREKSDTELRLEQLEREVGQLTGNTESEEEE